MAYDDTQHDQLEITIRRMDLDRADRARGRRARRARLRTSRSTGPVLGVEVEGTLLAAISLDRRRRRSPTRSAAPPSCATLLELRAAQLRRRERRRPASGAVDAPRGRRLARRPDHPPPPLGLRAPATRLSAADAHLAASRARRSQWLSSGAIVRPGVLELLPVELGGLARPGPDDRLAGGCGSGRRTGGPARARRPGITAASVRATWSKVLWSSLRTITCQLPPRPDPGPPVRGRSSVSVSIASPGSRRRSAIRDPDGDGDLLEGRRRRPSL